MSDLSYNKLELSGTAEEVTKVLEYISSKDDEGADILFDFSRVRPIPEELKSSGEIPEIRYLEEKELLKVADDAKNHFQLPDDELDRYIRGYPDKYRTVLGRLTDNLQKTGFTDISGWCEANWGTKLNASKTFIEDNVIWFFTAGDPIPVIEKLSSLFPSMKFNLYGGDANAPFKYHTLIYKEGALVYYQYEFDLEEAKEHNAESENEESKDLSTYKNFPPWFLSRFKKT